MSTIEGTDDRLRDDKGITLPRYTMRKYRMPAKIFHWVTAVLIILMIASGVTMKQLVDGPVADTLFNLHKVTGVLTLVIVLLRIAYRVFWPEPRVPHEVRRHPLLHWMLYAALILMPLLGWAGISDFGSRGIFFGYSLPAIWPEGAGYADLLLETHAYLAFAMLALVALHIGIALQDHLTRAHGPGESED